MSITKVTEVKAFTEDPQRGNPAVVIEASIDDPAALEAVRRARYSVAVVIDPSQSPVPIRFFYEFGATEPFACGHATLAAADVLLPREQGKTRSAFINKHGQVVEIVRKADGRISQKQPTPEFGEGNWPAEDAADTLGLETQEIRTDLPMELVGSVGKMKLLIPIKSEGAVVKVERDHGKVMELCRRTGATGLFFFATDVHEADAHARHFPNRDEEDPVCGVGSLALAHYFKKNNRADQNEFIIRCGPTLEGVGDVIVKIEDDQMFLEGYATSL